jgi:transposase
MAGTCKEMSKIKQVLRFHEDGFKNRAIGRKLGINKETVNKYVKLAKANPLGLDRLLEMDDPVLEWHLTGGNPAYSDPRFQILQDRLPLIASEMEKRSKTHVTLQLLWEEYKKDYPNGYGYTAVLFPLQP